MKGLLQYLYKLIQMSSLIMKTFFSLDDFSYLLNLMVLLNIPRRMSKVIARQKLKKERVLILLESFLTQIKSETLKKKFMRFWCLRSDLDDLLCTICTTLKSSLTPESKFLSQNLIQTCRLMLSTPIQLPLLHTWWLIVIILPSICMYSFFFVCFKLIRTQNINKQK